MDKTTSKDPSISEASAHVRDDITQLRETVERRQQEMTDQVKQLVTEHPVAAVGIAFGAGYLLSGALLSRFTLRIATAGARWYLSRMLRDAVGSGSFGFGGGNGPTGQA